MLSVWKIDYKADWLYPNLA